MGKPQGQTGQAAPEGGWGWVVVGALFLVSALVFGLIRSLGVFFVELESYFDESAQAVSWITSIGLAIQQLFSPFGTALCNLYGARPVVMFGGILAGLGLILASQATSLTHLYLTMGIISGSGWAFVFTPTVVSVMQYFTRRRSLAMALGFTGVGLSSFAFSPLFQLLVETYAWNGALLVLGGLSLNIVACGALIRPVATPKAVKQNLTESRRSSACRNFLSRVSMNFELPLLTQRPFLTYALAVTLFNSGYFVPYVHLVAHSRHEGFSEYQAAFVMSATGVADIIGRVVAGWASDLGRVWLPRMLTVWSGLVGVFLVLLPLGSLGGSYAGLMAISLAYGFCSGGMTPLVFAAVPEIVGMDRTLGALGLLHLIESLGGLLGAPLSGWLKDQTGSYAASFVMAGTFLLLGTAVTTTLPNFCTCTKAGATKAQSDAPEPSLESGLITTSLSSPTTPIQMETVESEDEDGNIHSPVGDPERSGVTSGRTEDDVSC
ncbi:monocarboxylate transporter 13-like [Denticeps clupeoides]|uniref:Monocarboxylate transporter 13 n=1 Tax=Denticeps clupeoides TaxID=299321 RepID=A0AAY4C8T5_9TELE|nr:monocarboxylate transporter 13-like [Denticeps clupeoides]